MNQKILISVLLMSVSFFATAGEPEESKLVFGEKVTPTEFPQLIEMVRAEIQPGGRWEYVPQLDRPILENNLKLMESLLTDHVSVEDMSGNEKMKLINAQERVNVLLLQHDGQRLICERYTPTGSHRPQKICLTLAQRRKTTEDSQRMIENLQKSRLLPVKQ